MIRVTDERLLRKIL